MLSDKEILDIYYAVPAALRKHSHWVMSEETLRRQIGHSSGRIGDDTRYLCGKRIQLDPEAVGIALVPECVCELLDISDLRGPKFIRGFSNGCAIHPPTEYELRAIAAEEEARRRVEAAKREARERP